LNKKKFDNNNKKLEGIMNNRYKRIKKLGDGSQGTVFEVEDINESNLKLKRKAIKKYHPIPVEVSESLKWVEEEIEVLKKLSGKSEYVLNYLDSFVTLIDDNEFKVYHVVNNLCEVNIYIKFRLYCTIITI
jgi:serine/threonine protein kinase